jgi:hypothetical protein
MENQEIGIMNMKVLLGAEEKVAEPLCILEGRGAWCCIYWW